jgi:hypothetical protein
MSRIMTMCLITLISMGSAHAQTGAPVPVRKVPPPAQLYLVNQSAAPLLVDKFDNLSDCKAAITDSGGKDLSSGSVKVILVCVATAH